MQSTAPLPPKPWCDGSTTLQALMQQVQALCVRDARGRALMCDASGMRPDEVLFALLDAQRASV